MAKIIFDDEQHLQADVPLVEAAQLQDIIKELSDGENGRKAHRDAIRAALKAIRAPADPGRGMRVFLKDGRRIWVTSQAQFAVLKEF